MNRILGLSWLTKNSIVASIGADNHIKLFDVGTTKIVGGGSLAKRLQNAFLTCMEVEQKTGNVYIGTSSNVVLIYNINPSTYKVKHLHSINFDAKESPVTSLCLKGK